ncbi:MAG: peptidase M22 [Clostridia bacterium]|nr:peptidase M22 [Clostridia bacterium]
MMLCLGIDTSNYTTSAALYDSVSGELLQSRRLLTVKEGELGLRQSDAVFQHTVNLPDMIDEVTKNLSRKIDAVAVSVSPRDEKGSYMPCFMAGKGAARMIADVTGAELRFFSHQAGHIAAALYSADALELLRREFIAFHVSGGTTEAVKVSPSEERIFSVEMIASSLDLKAGQAIDRTGNLLGLPFPSGMMLDKLSLESDRTYKIKPFMRDGNCSLSGLQNKCEKMKRDGESDADIAKFCIDYISQVLYEMTKNLTEKYPGLPLVYSGGVMSNTLIRKRFSEEFGAVFAAPGFSSDNAAGLSVLASL